VKLLHAWQRRLRSQDAVLFLTGVPTPQAAGTSPSQAHLKPPLASSIPPCSTPVENQLEFPQG